MTAMRFIACPLVMIVLGLGALSAYGQDAADVRLAVESCDRESVNIAAAENLDKAIEGLRERVKTNPSMAECRIQLGYLLLKKNSNEEAMQEFDAALQRMPRSHSAKTGKGIALARKGDLKAAEIVFKDALVLNPDPVKVHYELGLVYEKTGNLDKALSEFREGVDKYEKGRK